MTTLVDIHITPHLIPQPVKVLCQKSMSKITFNLEETNSNDFIDTEYDVLELSGDFPDDDHISNILRKLLDSEKKINSLVFSMNIFDPGFENNCMEDFLEFFSKTKIPSVIVDYPSTYDDLSLMEKQDFTQYTDYYVRFVNNILKSVEKNTNIKEFTLPDIYLNLIGL